MSGAQTSPFPNMNDLLAQSGQEIANYYAPERNRLLIETAKQEQGGREMEAMSRAASGLLALPDEETRAAQYPKTIQYLQANGFAKNAPPVYPGEAVTKHLASLGIPAADQYKLAADRSAKQALFPDAPGAGTGAATAPAVPGGAYGQGGGNTAAPPAELMPHFQEASTRTGIPVDVLIALARQESSFNANAVGGAGEIGIGQILPSTAKSPGYGIAPVDPAALKDPRTNINFAADYLKALLPPGADPKDPAAIRAALLRYNGGGDPNYVNNVTRYLPAPGGTATAAAPAPGGGVAARIPGAVDVAGPGAGGTTAEQSGNQSLLNRLSVFGGGGTEPPPVAPAVAPVVAPAVAAPAVPAAPAVAAPAATPAVPDLPVPQAPNIQANGFTPQQTAWLRTLRDNPSVSADEFRKAQDTLRTQNTAAVEKYQADVRAYRQDVETRQEHARAQARWEAEQKNKGVPSGYRISAADPNKLEPIPGGPKDPTDPENVGKLAKNDAEIANLRFNQANKLRDEFQTLTKDFRTVQTSYESLQRAAQAKDGASDMSLLYNYVRLLDPTSVVRESEFAAAAGSGSLGQRMQGAVERIMTGGRLSDELRDNFVRESRNLYDVQLRSHDTVADQYERLAKDTGIDPKVVVTRFARPQPEADAAPVVVRTDADFDKLPSGTLFIAPDGTKRRKP